MLIANTRMYSTLAGSGIHFNSASDYTIIGAITARPSICAGLRCSGNTNAATLAEFHNCKHFAIGGTSGGSSPPGRFTGPSICNTDVEEVRAPPLGLAMTTVCDNAPSAIPTLDTVLREGLRLLAMSATCKEGQLGGERGAYHRL
jgi:hypothetical protein